jgi:hypothetical protein
VIPSPPASSIRHSASRFGQQQHRSTRILAFRQPYGDGPRVPVQIGERDDVLDQVAAGLAQVGVGPGVAVRRDLRPDVRDEVRVRDLDHVLDKRRTVHRIITPFALEDHCRVHQGSGHQRRRTICLPTRFSPEPGKAAPAVRQVGIPLPNIGKGHDDR